MILTEKEASTRRCQEGFAPPHSDNITNLSASVSSVYSVGAAVATMHVQTFSPAHCIGSRCMAWRWMKPEALVTESDGSELLGYCGKVGKP